MGENVSSVLGKLVVLCSPPPDSVALAQEVPSFRSSSLGSGTLSTLCQQDILVQKKKKKKDILVHIQSKKELNNLKLGTHCPKFTFSYVLLLV